MNIHIVFGKKDADLSYWISMLPSRMMSHYIRSALISEKAKTYAIIPIPDAKGLLDKKIDTKFYLTDRSLIAYIKSFDKETMSSVIKRILRKHLEWNYQNAILHTKKTDSNNRDLDSAVCDDDEMSDEYRKMLMELAGRK